MVTFEQLVKITAKFCGTTNNVQSSDIFVIKQNINTGLKRFKNGARVAFTRGEMSTSLSAGKQFYQLPPDCVRVTTVRVNGAGVLGQLPMEEILSEDDWNMVNRFPQAMSLYPTRFFIRGSREIGVFPTPSMDGKPATGGSDAVYQMIVSYERRNPDMVLYDITDKKNVFTGNSANNDANGGPTPVTATVTNGSPDVVFSQPILNIPGNALSFQVTDGSDGNVYTVSQIIDASHLVLDNFYAGGTNAHATFVIGQCPDIPEEFHLAPAYFAAAQFFYMRKDNGQGSMYDGMFQALVTEYKNNYGQKTTNRASKQASYFANQLVVQPPMIVS